MQGPNDTVRSGVSDRLDVLQGDPTAPRVVNSTIERGLDEILEYIEQSLLEALEIREDAADATLDAINAWAGLGSYAIARVYGPASRLPSGLGGWSQKAVERLRGIGDKLKTELFSAAEAIGADDFSLDVGFPWGISVGLGWSTANARTVNKQIEDAKSELDRLNAERAEAERAAMVAAKREALKEHAPKFKL